MELFIGGYSQGKTEYVTKLYPNRVLVDGANLELGNNTSEVIGNVKKLLESKNIILNHLNLLVKKLIEIGINSEQILKIFTETSISEEIIIICDEVGSGVVPIKKKEREYRESVGRIQVELAKKSESVVRIICQIPMKLK